MKTTLKIILFDPTMVSLNVLVASLEELPVRFVPMHGVEGGIRVVDSLIEVKKGAK